VLCLSVGRTEEIQFFKQNILEPESPSHNIVSIYGPAGVGKSTLLSQIIAITQDPHYNSYCSTAIVDKRDADPLLIMDKFATQLQIKGKFRKLLDRYTELLQKQKSEQEDANYKILQKGVDIASSIIKDVPAPILNTFASKGTEFQ
jgi:ABC-type nitrate/sulfonate/bicarbonate transport system ATPase subunit